MLLAAGPEVGNTAHATAEVIQTVKRHETGDAADGAWQPAPDQLPFLPRQGGASHQGGVKQAQRARHCGCHQIAIGAFPDVVTAQGHQTGHQRFRAQGATTGERQDPSQQLGEAVLCVQSFRGSQLGQGLFHLRQAAGLPLLLQQAQQ